MIIKPWTGRKFKLPTCPRESQTVKAHKIELHPVYNLRCDFCEFSTNMQNVLQNHIVLTHPSKPFSYEKCEYQSATEVELTKHSKNSHSHPQVIVCKFCELAFTDLNQILNHVKTNHATLSTACKFCGMKFNDANLFQDHILQHHEGGFQERKVIFDFLTEFKSQTMTSINLLIDGQRSLEEKQNHPNNIQRDSFEKLSNQINEVSKEPEKAKATERKQEKEVKAQTKPKLLYLTDSIGRNVNFPQVEARAK